MGNKKRNSQVCNLSLSCATLQVQFLRYVLIYCLHFHIDITGNADNSYFGYKGTILARYKRVLIGVHGLDLKAQEEKREPISWNPQKWASAFCRWCCSIGFIIQQPLAHTEVVCGQVWRGQDYKSVPHGSFPENAGLLGKLLAQVMEIIEVFFTMDGKMEHEIE